MGRAPLVAPSRVSEILERLEPVAQELVLVSGQAVHFWTSRYKERVPELRRDWPYTTKDVDFCGTVAQARACARVLVGELRELTVADRTPCIAIIDLGDMQIDFLRVPYVLDPRMPDAFRECRYPQVKAQVEAKRVEFDRSVVR